MIKENVQIILEKNAIQNKIFVLYFALIFSYKT